jgi:uncharacterized repeat protein (TIGR01451 family)
MKPLRRHGIRLGAAAFAAVGLIALLPGSAIAATADLAVDKTDGLDQGASVTVGSEISYTITVTNGGPDPATGVELVDHLSNRLDFVSADASQGICTGSKKVTCTLGIIPSDGSATVTIKVTAKKAGQVVNNASVTTTDTDPVNGNDSDRETTNIVEPVAVTCSGQEADFVGTEGTDTLTGTKKRDVFAALGGNDTIVGLEGNDLVCGGSGDDTIRGESGNDAIKSGGGNDLVKGGNDNDLLKAGGGNDLMKGGAGVDTLRGKAGDDSLGGGSGDDSLRGGGGSDSCKGGPGTDAKFSC